MAGFLPTQEPGPGPTDASLATYQSYSAYTTSIYDYTTTITRVIYDPQGSVAPSLVIQTQTGPTTSIGYSVVNLPLLYTGPFPAPPLGTLFTTPGQVLPTSQPTVSQPSQPNPTGTAGSPSGSSASQGQGPAPPSQSVSAPGPVNTGLPPDQGQGSPSGGSESEGSISGSNETGGSSAGGNGDGSSQGQSNPQDQSNGSNQGVFGDAGNGQNGGNGTDSQGGGSTEGNGSAAQGSGANNGNGQGSGQSGGTSGGESGNGPQTGGSGPGATGSQSQTGPAPTGAPTSFIGSSASASASLASVSASNAAASASQASVSATDASQSSAASAASASASSAASSASVLSQSASSLSASASGASSSLSGPLPTSTNGGEPPGGGVQTFNSNGLSGGQIAGIVIGSIAALLLLLLLALCLRRRRRKYGAGAAAAGAGAVGAGSRRKLSDKWANGLSRGGSRGAYRSLGIGAGAGAAGLGLARAGRAERGSIHSDEWEEDHLSGGNGSGFFVVGGRRLGQEGQGTTSTGSFSRTEANAGRSGASTGAGLAGLGAGIAAVLTGRKASGGKGKESDHQPVPTSRREADMADEDDVAGSDEDGDVTSERRGLMDFADVGNGSEMAQAGPSGWTSATSPHHASWKTAATAAGAGAIGAGAMYAADRQRSRRSLRQGDDQDPSSPFADSQSGVPASNSGGSESTWLAGGLARPSTGRSAGGYSSSAGHYQSSASGTASGSKATGSGSRSGSGSGPNNSSNSTGVRTDESPQVGFSSSSAGGDHGAVRTYGNIPPHEASSSRQSRIPNFTRGFGDGDLGMLERHRAEEMLVGAGAAGVGLGALAAHHRDSRSDNGHDDRNSRFISKDTPLLGPQHQQEDLANVGVRPSGQADGRNASTFGTSAAQHNRLPTIRSVGEFGERSSGSASQSGTGGTGNTGSGSGSGSGTRSGYGSVNSPPIYVSSAHPSTVGLPFSTPISSPIMEQEPRTQRQSLQDIPDEESSSQQHGATAADAAEAAGGAAAAGFFGGLFPGWTLWSTNGEDHKSAEGQDTVSNEAQVQEGGSATHERGQVSAADQTAEVQSQRASVHNEGSTLDHSGLVSHRSSMRQSRQIENASASGSGSGSGSGNASGAASLPSRPSQPEALAEADEESEMRGEIEDDQDVYAAEADDEGAGGGYTASVSNLSQNVSSGNSRSDSRRSGQTTSTGLSQGGNTSNSHSGNSSGSRHQLSSSGSTGAASYNPSHLARHSQSSSRGGATSSSLSSRGAVRGGHSSSSRRRREDMEGDNEGSFSDGQSSRATAGGGEDLHRSSMDPGLRSVEEGQEETLPSSDFYPSESLGAAVRRRAVQEAQEQREDVSTPRVIPTSLIPGSPATASQWRQSPRVQSASERAAANLERDEAPPVPPRRSRLSDPEQPRSEETQEEGDSSRGLWGRIRRM